MSDRNDHDVRDLLVTGALLYGAAYMGRNHPKVLGAIFFFFGFLFGTLFLIEGYWVFAAISIVIPFVIVGLDNDWRTGRERAAQLNAVTNVAISRQKLLLEYKKAGAMVCPNCKCRVFPSDNCFYCGYDLM